jgi:hypothetical protein
MPFPKIYIDAMLLNWGDRLFRDPLRHAGAPQLAHVPTGNRAMRMREQLARTLRRTPEVMVRITNRADGAQGMGAVRQHFRYISRNGTLELEDQDGQVIVGAAAFGDLADAWQFGGWGMPQTSVHREVFNILLSMPPGTDRCAVRDAARNFAAGEFGDGRAYVFAAHDDEAHPHVHLSVQARGPDGQRLHPQKYDLQRWRERFAQQLREHGVEANATSRRIRGQTRRYPKQAIVHMMDRGETPKYWRAAATEEQGRVDWAAHFGVFDMWREMARVMAASPASGDRRTAVEIVDFVREMPVQQAGPAIQRRELERRERPDETIPNHDGPPEWTATMSLSGVAAIILAGSEESQAA